MAAALSLSCRHHPGNHRGDLLRATFRHTHGEATVDVHVTGAAGALAVRGSADLRGAHLVPYDIDTPLDIPTGQLELYPDRASLHNLKLVVDGAETIADGTYKVSRPLFVYVKNAHVGVIPGLAEYVTEFLKGAAAGGYLAAQHAVAR